MYYEEKGNMEAPTIIFIHGGGVSGWMWKKQIEYFKDYHCIIPDLPEHGRSIDEGPLSIGDCADKIAELIETRANGKRAHVVGHSLGGKIIVELLGRRPELVDHAVVASALFRPIALLTAIHKPFIYKLTIWMIKPKSMLSYFVKQFGFPDNSYNENCIADFQKLDADKLYREYDQLHQYLKLPGRLERADVPTLVMAGGKEPGAMRQSVKDIAERLPNAKGIIIKKGTHTYPWALPDSFNEIIKLWLSGKPIENYPGIEISK